MTDPSIDIDFFADPTGARTHVPVSELQRLTARAEYAEARAEHALALVAEAYEVSAREADCGCAGRAAVLDADTKTDRWRACGTDPCGAETAQFIRSLTPSDALAALEARDKRVRREALREAADCVGHITQAEDRDAILALIEGGQTDE